MAGCIVGCLLTTTIVVVQLSFRVLRRSWLDILILGTICAVTATPPPFFFDSSIVTVSRSRITAGRPKALSYPCIRAYHVNSRLWTLFLVKYRIISRLD